MSNKLFPQFTGQKSASMADRLQKTVNEAHDEYRDKSYAEEYRGAYHLAKTATGIGHAMSIAFGFTFIFATAYMLLFGNELAAINWSEDWLQIITAALVTGAVLIFLIEGIKSSAFNSVCRSHLKQRFGLLPYFIPLSIAGCLAIASVFFSVQGALQVAELHTFVPDSAKVNITQIWFGTDAGVTAIDQRIEKLEKGNPPYGWPHGWTDKKTGKHHLNNKGKNERSKLQSEKGKLVAARDSRLSDGRQYNTRIETASEVDRMLYGGTGAGLSVLAELIILFSIAYRHRYKYKANQEGELGIGFPFPSRTAEPGHIGFSNQPAPAMEDQRNSPRGSSIGFQQAGVKVHDLQGLAGRLAKLEAKLDYYRPADFGPKSQIRGESRQPDGQGFPIICEHCKKEALMKSTRAKYCSNRCKKDAYNQKNPNNQVRFK